MRTRPSESRVAVANARAVVIESVALKPGVGVGEGLGVETGLGLPGEQPAIARARGTSKPARQAAREIPLERICLDLRPCTTILGVVQERIVIAWLPLPATEA
jgi:hypothetical protein